MELEPFPQQVIDIPSLKKFYGTRTKGLYHDKSILWVLLMKRNLMWAEAYLVALCCLQFYVKKVPEGL